MDCIYCGCLTKNAGTWRIAKGQLILLMLFLAHILVFIVNNGNILMYRTDERKHIKRKHNEL